MDGEDRSPTLESSTGNDTYEDEELSNLDGVEFSSDEDMNRLFASKQKKRSSHPIAGISKKTRLSRSEQRSSSHKKLGPRSKSGPPANSQGSSLQATPVNRGYDRGKYDSLLQSARLSLPKPKRVKDCSPETPTITDTDLVTPPSRISRPFRDCFNHPSENGRSLLPTTRVSPGTPSIPNPPSFSSRSDCNGPTRDRSSSISRTPSMEVEQSHIDVSIGSSDEDDSISASNGGTNQISQALKEMTNVLGTLVKRVERNATEIKALKKTLETSATPSSSNDSSSSKKRQIPPVVRVCLG